MRRYILVVLFLFIGTLGVSNPAKEKYYKRLDSILVQCDSIVARDLVHNLNQRIVKYREPLAVIEADQQQLLQIVSESCPELNWYTPRVILLRGFIEEFKGNSTKAVYYFNEAIQFCIDHKYNVISELNYLIGSNYYNVKAYEKAIHYYKLAEEEFISTEDKEHFDKGTHWSTLNTLALAYQNLGKKKEAIEYYKKAIDFAMESGSKIQEAISKGNLGSVYMRDMNYTLALPFLKEDYTHSLEVGEKYSAIAAVTSLSECFYKLDQLDSAEFYFIEAQELSAQLNGAKQEDLSFLGYKLYAAKQQPYKAYNYIEAYKKSVDATINEFANKDLEGFRVKYQLENSLVELNNAQLNSQKRLFLSLLALVFVIGLSAFLVVVYQKNKALELKEKQLEEANQVKSKLISIIGHDLKAPLSSLISLFDLFNSKELGPTEL